MSFEAAVQPVILLGMHRSGTAMIARLLDELGLFQGHELQDDHESTWFLEINEQLLKRVGATWDNPEPITAFLDNPDAFDLTVRCLEDDLSSKRTRDFLGRKLSKKFGVLPKLESPWGWKDPRAIYTLPLFLKLFPQAKLVYIIRNGVDVASSLRVREVRELKRRREQFDSKPASGDRSRLQRAGFKGSARCLTLEGGFSLWEEYVNRAEQNLAQVGNPKLTLRYESFLADPLAPLIELAHFCGLDADESAARAAITKVGVNASRANAFLADPIVNEFHGRVRGSRWMTHYGYHE